MFCRLCLTEPKFENYLNIFDDGENLSHIIAQHLSFEPKVDDFYKIICKTCWEILEHFHNFYTKIEDAQKRFYCEIFIKSESPPTTTTTHTIRNSPNYVKSELMDEPEKNILETPKNKNICSVIDSIFNVSDLPEKNTVEEIITKTENKNPSKKRRKVKKVKYHSDSNDDCELQSKSPKKLIKIVMKKSIKPISSKINENSDDDNDPKLENKKSSDEIDLKISKFMKLRCDVCLKDEPTFTEIKKHFRAVHNMLGYVICCEKKFNKRVYLSDHVDTHLNPEQFKCQICNRIQSNHNSLRQHIKVVHETPRNFECDVCQKKMSNRYALELHKYTHIPVEERAFKCADCEKTFASEYQMKMHWSKVHETLANNICYVCGKIIKDIVLFKKHQLEHEGIVEPKAQCEKCGLWLKNVLSLRKHVRNLHSEEDEDHICSICNKLCRSRAALKSHKFYVHSSRTYPCTVCAKEFKKTITLREHMSTHTGEVLYTCPHCPKTFTSNANLHHHRKRNHRKEWEEKRASKLLPPLNADATENFDENFPVFS